MEHVKIKHSEKIVIEGRSIEVTGPLGPEELRSCRMHEGLNAFREPEEQLEALIDIAGLPEGRITAALVGDHIVGYVTFHYPDELERWSQGKMNDLIELGAIEITRAYRSYGLGKRLLQLSFRDRQMERYIVFTTEYYWHWDLEGTGLNVWDYRKMMERLMRTAGMESVATDDPEICSHPANCLMVRIGDQVPPASLEQFDRVRFQRRFMY